MVQKIVEERAKITLEQLLLTVGEPGRASQWLHVDQPLIDAFADATDDHTFIHVDPDRAAKTQFRGTIAHGLLTLSLLPKLLRTATPLLQGYRVGVNYGFERVRFIAPVPVNSRIRGVVALVEVAEKKAGLYVFTYDVTIEIENNPKPAATARWMLGRWMETTPP
jgi:acyl dehydratase